MANLCENVLRVSGYHDDLVRFGEAFRAGKEDREEYYHFDNLYPTPELSICDRVDWRKEHWGINGNFYEESFLRDVICEGDMEVYYYFDTPWVAPERLIEFVSKNYPELNFLLIFYIDGSGGINEYSGGDLISEEHLSYDDRKYWFGDDEILEGA
ncbi:MAG: hypothetical protein BWY15_02375 [Firmicutes bacterium ADurb.Bin193]|nr:MAG: hypothetical protein BWY15_02375 [Firmicutes bacterium ADurb.Bin193]